MAGRLAGKVAIVTGSTSGIGKATAIQFAREGAKVVVNGRRNELGQQVVAQIRAEGGAAEYHPADMAHSDQIQALIAFTVATYGRLDVLMSNAYSGRNGPVTELAEEDWDYGLDVGLKAAYLLCKYGIPHMVAGGGGSIIITSSPHGVMAAGRAMPYAVIKAALINLARQVAVDYGPQGIRCNSILPGWIITERVAEYLAQDSSRLNQTRYTYPLKRPGEPIEIAHAAVFLASDEASFVTGHALVVDGGLTCQLQDSLADRIEAALGVGYGAKRL
ncbi:MAG: glucose 1-dehydrogenase, partial [Chloroflexota bacterium]